MKPLKKLALLTATGLALTLVSGVAYADSHEGAHDSKKHHKGAKMFQKMDSDSDGVITEAEFVKASQERFSKMDGNGDGQVTQDEAKAAGDKWKEKMKERRAKKNAE